MNRIATWMVWMGLVSTCAWGAPINYSRIARAVLLQSVDRNLDFSGASGQAEVDRMAQLLQQVYEKRLTAAGQKAFSNVAEYAEGTISVQIVDSAVQAAIFNAMGSALELVLPASTGSPDLDQLLKDNGVTKLKASFAGTSYMTAYVPVAQNHYLIAKALNAMPQVMTASVNALIGDRSQLHYIKDFQKGWHETFALQYAWGDDCLSGCTESRRGLVDVQLKNGTPISSTLAGTSGDPLPAGQPEIFQ